MAQLSKCWRNFLSKIHGCPPVIYPSQSSIHHATYRGLRENPHDHRGGGLVYLFQNVSDSHTQGPPSNRARTLGRHGRSIRGTRFSTHIRTHTHTHTYSFIVFFSSISLKIQHTHTQTTRGIIDQQEQPDQNFFPPLSGPQASGDGRIKPSLAFIPHSLCLTQSNRGPYCDATSSS